MAYYDPLSSLSMAPTAAQLQYREEVPERIDSFVSSVAPSAKAFGKDLAGGFKHAFVGDSYDQPYESSVVSSTVSGDGKDSSLYAFWQQMKDSMSGSDPAPTMSGSGKVQAKPITYSDWSDAARYFGMNQSTAYAEHMANTAHQREVADLRAAGLNPVLGMGSGASGVTGHVASSGGASSARKSSDESGLVDTVGATIGFIAALLGGDTAGRFASKAVSGLGKLFEKK